MTSILNNNDNNKPSIYFSMSVVVPLQPGFSKDLLKSYYFFSSLHSPTHSNLSPVLYQTNISQEPNNLTFKFTQKKINSQSTWTQRSVWYGWSQAPPETMPTLCFPDT